MKKFWTISSLALTMAMTMVYCNTPNPGGPPSETDTTMSTAPTTSDTTQGGGMTDTSGRTDTSGQQLLPRP